MDLRCAPPIFTDADREHARARLTANLTWQTRDRDGADFTGLSRGDLEQRRTDVLARLASDDLTPEQADQATTEAENLRAAIDSWNERVARNAAARDALLGATPEERVARPGAGQDRAPARTEERVMRLGERVVTDEAFRQFRARGKSGTAAIDLPGGIRALFTTETGGVAQPDRRPGVVQVTREAPLRIADLIDRQTTTQSSVEYVRDNLAAENENAAEVAEGGVKPESDWSLTEETAPVRTIAHFTNITRQAADDDAQMVGYIEGRLAFGLERRLDRQILAGDGTAPNLRGILNTSGIGTYVAPAAEAAVVSIRRGITVAQESEYDPDTVVLHPQEWERIDLSTDNSGAFRLANAANATQPRVWGLTVVTSTAVANTAGTVGGTALIGSFREGATLWEREGVRILMTDSHASNFTSNILTLLAEMRAGLSIWRPRAFVAVTLGTDGN